MTAFLQSVIITLFLCTLTITAHPRPKAENSEHKPQDEVNQDVPAGRKMSNHTPASGIGASLHLDGIVSEKERKLSKGLKATREFEMNSLQDDSSLLKTNHLPGHVNISTNVHHIGNVKQFFAFSAELSQDSEVGAGSTIIFDRVLESEGGGYDETNGNFICPDSGLYMFIWNVVMAVSSASRCVTALAMGGQDVKFGPKTNYLANEYSGVSQMMTVVQCSTNPQDAVSVVSRINPAPTFNNHFSTFSGYRLASVPSAIGFTVELSMDALLIPGGRIMFDKVITNVGGHYAPEHGYFQCPDNGLYSFSVSTHFPAGVHQWSVSRLKFGAETIFSGPITYKATPTVDSGSSSVTVLLECRQGNNVYVEAAQCFTYPYNVYGATLTSFTGAKLCYENCDDGFVAFSALLTQNVTDSGRDIVFDNVLLNRGSAYNPSTGIFICPNNFLYMFTWSAASNGGGSYVLLFVNPISVKSNFMTPTAGSEDSSGTSGTSTMSIIIRCSVGDQVSLRASVPRILLADFTTFSGYQLPGQ